MYYLDEDNDGHWYVVPVELSEVWQKWLSLPDDNPESWEPPDGCEQVGGSPTLVRFSDYIIGDELEK